MRAKGGWSRGNAALLWCALPNKEKKNVLVVYSDAGWGRWTCRRGRRVCDETAWNNCCCSSLKWQQIYFRHHFLWGPKWDGLFSYWSLMWVDVSEMNERWAEFPKSVFLYLCHDITPARSRHQLRVSVTLFNHELQSPDCCESQAVADKGHRWKFNYQPSSLRVEKELWKHKVMNQQA